MRASAARVIEAIPEELLTEPLDWLFAEHFRQRQLCGLIRSLAESRAFHGDRIAEALGFLERDLPLHLVDEEEDLFPLLRRRAESGEVDRLLGALSADHRADIDHAREVRAILSAALADRRPPGLDAGVRKALLDFASHEHRHLALENAVVLPLGRKRLAEEDLADLGRRMAARRGLVLETP